MSQLLCIATLLAICGTSHCSCPEHMLDYKEERVCIGFYKEYLTDVEAADTCRKQGGRLAGYAFDIVAQMNINPDFKTLIPEPKAFVRYWADVSQDLDGKFMYDLWLVYLEMFIQGSHFALRHNKGIWSSELWGRIDRTHPKEQFLCEFDKPKEEMPQIQPSVSDKSEQEEAHRKHSDKPTKERPQETYLGRKIVRKESTGMYRVDTPAFERRMPSVSFCTRVCSKASNCDHINFNPSTGQCVGYNRDADSEYENKPGWEIWRCLAGITLDMKFGLLGRSINDTRIFCMCLSDCVRHCWNVSQALNDYKHDLICLVQKTPLLWDPRDKDYKNKDQRKQVWEKIDEKLQPPVEGGQAACLLDTYNCFYSECY